MAPLILSRKCLIVALYTILVSYPYFNDPATVIAEDRASKLSPLGKFYFKHNWKDTMWTRERSKILDTASDVSGYLSELNNGEFNDWRLPTKKELHDLFMIFDLKYNGEVKIRIEGRYWLVNDDGKVTVGSWEIGDGCGPDRIFYTGKNGHVMAIRP